MLNGEGEGGTEVEEGDYLSLHCHHQNGYMGLLIATLSPPEWLYGPTYRYTVTTRMTIWAYLSLHCHHQNDSCLKMGSNQSHFNVSLIVRDKVTSQCSQTTIFEEKGWPKRIGLNKMCFICNNTLTTEQLGHATSKITDISTARVLHKWRHEHQPYRQEGEHKRKL